MNVDGGCCFFTKGNTKKIMEYTITTAKASKTSRLVAFGSLEGVLALSILTEDEENINGIFQISISGSQINDLDWINNGLIGMASEESVYVYDPVKDATTVLREHLKLVTCVKNKDNNIFFTGARDGYAFGWDKRTGSVCHSLFHQCNGFKYHEMHPVCSIEPSIYNDKVIYTAASPGGLFNMWDLRYLHNGAFKNTEKKITNRIIDDIKHSPKGIYALDYAGCLYKLSQDGSKSEEIKRISGGINEDKRHTLHFNEYLGLIMYVDDDNLCYINPETSDVYTTQVDNISNIIPLESGKILGYLKSGYIVDFQVTVRNLYVINSFNR